MAWTEFYIQNGASDVNAGSTTSNAAAVSVANASWDVTADTYIGLTGIEFAGVNVGDWASIYLDAATVAVYIAQVTAVGALGVSITLSTTAKYGTKPASGATGRSCKVGGAHASELPWASGGLGTTTVPASTRVNWKAFSGAPNQYTLAASRSFNITGATAAPVWFRGYSVTPGDCDGDPSLPRPVLALSATFVITFNAVHQLWSSFTITGSRSGSILSAAGANSTMERVTVDNTSSNAAAIAMTVSAGAGFQVIACRFKTPTTATTTGTVSTAAATNPMFIGCVFEGGGIAGVNIGASTNVSLIGCVCLSNTGSGVLLTTGGVRMLYCTIISPTVDGVKWTGTPTASTIVACLIVSAGGFGINQASGAVTNLVVRAANKFFGCTSGNENTVSGFGDSPSMWEATEPVTPFVGAPSDLRLISSALSRRGGSAPGNIEGQTYRSGVAAGAVDPADAVMIATVIASIIVGRGSAGY